MGFRCHHLSRAFDGRTGTVLALEDVTFGVADREFVCIVGPSGCGKTTLLRLIAGLVAPTSGKIVFESGTLDGHLRSALVFQEHGLFPWMDVLDNVAFGLEMQGMGRPERRDRAQAFIEQIGLGGFGRSLPHELSVGMRQRVGIARAFVADPHMLLMDEPLGSLDAQTKLVLQQELLRIWKDHQKLVVFVTHDIEEAIRLGDRVLVMTGRPGRIREDLPIPAERPRDLTSSRPELTEIKWHIWKLLEEEVRASLNAGFRR
jgi:NitT/TauT family transport system ATP-binding protein